MIVNVVDTKCDFKKKIENDFKPNTISEYVDGLISIEKEIGKRIMVNIRGLLWRTEEVKNHSVDSLTKDLEILLSGDKILNIEISDL